MQEEALVVISNSLMRLEIPCKNKAFRGIIILVFPILH